MNDNLTSNDNISAPVNPPERNYGIDLLRVISMFYVVVLHTLGIGGILNADEIGPSQFRISNFLEAWAFCAVDIFALISGYVSYRENGKKVNVSGWIVMWFQVVFYNVGGALVHKMIDPSAVSASYIKGRFLPLTYGSYWYFNAYTGLLVLMPLLNAGLNHCSEKTLKRITAIIIILFSLMNLRRDRFGLEGGYSVLWIVSLYLLGAMIKKFGMEKSVKGYHAVIIIVACNILTWAQMMDGPSVLYKTPSVLISSIFYLIVFSKLKASPKVQKLISFLSAGAFAVYLLNCQNDIWLCILEDRFAYLAKRPPAELFFHVIGFSLAFLIAAILIDHIRIKLFELLRVKKLADRLVSLAERAI